MAVGDPTGVDNPTGTGVGDPMGVDPAGVGDPMGVDEGGEEWEVGAGTAEEPLLSDVPRALSSSTSSDGTAEDGDSVGSVAAAARDILGNEPEEAVAEHPAVEHAEEEEVDPDDVDDESDEPDDVDDE